MRQLADNPATCEYPHCPSTHMYTHTRTMLRGQRSMRKMRKRRSSRGDEPRHVEGRVKKTRAMKRKTNRT